MGLGFIIMCVVGIGLVGIGVAIDVVRKIRMADHVVEVSWSVSAPSPDPPLVYQVAPATFQACLRHQSCLSPAERARREMAATAAQAICVNNSTGPEPLPLILIHVQMRKMMVIRITMRDDDAFQQMLIAFRTITLFP